MIFNLIICKNYIMNIMNFKRETIFSYNLNCEFYRMVV